MFLDELKKILSLGESESIEFKKSTGQRTETAKTACTLLNGLGGVIIFGVSHKWEEVTDSVQVTFSPSTIFRNNNPKLTTKLTTKN